MDPRVSSTLCQSYSKVQCAGKTGFHSGLNGSCQDGGLQYEAGSEIAQASQGNTYLMHILKRMDLFIIGRTNIS